MKQPDDISDGYDAEDNSRKSYDLAISAMREKLESFRCERIGPHKLYLGDCRSLLPLLPKVDAVVTDPPYGVNYEGSTTKHGTNGFAYASFDDTPEAIETICVPAVRAAVAIARSAVVTPGNANAFRYDEPRSIGAIYYPSGANSGPWGFVCSQPLFYYGKDPYLAKALGRLPNAFATTEATDRTVDHPCPKPLGQTKWLVNRVSLEGETVLDPFMGSGTTGVACVKMGRKFIGIEVEPRYFEVACRRVEEAMKQPDLLIDLLPPEPIQISLLEPDMTSKEKAAQQKALTVDGSRIIAEAKKREEHEATMLVEAAIEAAAPSNLDAREEWDRLRKLDQAVEDIKLMTKGLRYVRRGRVESVSLVARPGVGRQLAAEVASVMDRPIDLGAPDPEAPEYTPPAIKAAPVVERKKRRAKA